MREEDVPQDKGVLDDKQVVSYALNDEGRYCLTPSAGWEPVNCANRLAWEDIQAELVLVRSQIARGGDESSGVLHDACTNGCGPVVPLFRHRPLAGAPAS